MNHIPLVNAETIRRLLADMKSQPERYSAEYVAQWEEELARVERDYPESGPRA